LEPIQRAVCLEGKSWSEFQHSGKQFRPKWCRRCEIADHGQFGELCLIDAGDYVGDGNWRSKSGPMEFSTLCARLGLSMMMAGTCHPARFGSGTLAESAALFSEYRSICQPWRSRTKSLHFRCEAHTNGALQARRMPFLPGTSRAMLRGTRRARKSR